MEKLKSIGSMLLGLLVIAALLVVIGIVIGGAGWISEHLLPWFWLASFCAFVLIVLLLLPLSIPSSTRTFAVVAIYCLSYLFVATAWMEGLVTTLDTWGGFAVAIGIFLGGVGIVPIGLLAALFHGLWSVLFEMLALIVLTVSCRGFVIWMETRSQQISQQESFYLED